MAGYTEKYVDDNNSDYEGTNSKGTYKKFRGPRTSVSKPYSLGNKSQIEAENMANMQSPKFAQNQQKIQNMFDSYKKGGKVKRTGLAYLHKGERVVTRAKTEALEKKKGGMDKEC